MRQDHPDRDSLSAYIEEALSIDATQWIDRHLEGCVECQEKLEQERRFLWKLDELNKIDPPADFTAAVMARVAQYPTHQPRVEVSWRKVAVWASGLAAVLVVMLGIFGAMVMGSAPLDTPEGSGAASRGIVTIIELAKNVFIYGGVALEWARDSVRGAGTVLSGLFEFVRNQGLGVQLAVLLLTVGLNYFFTRLVLNYQRRH